MTECGQSAKGPTEIQFIEPKVAALRGWMEGPDADQCLFSMEYQAEASFEAAVMLADEEGNEYVQKQYYVCGLAMAAAVQPMRIKLEATKPWVDTGDGAADNNVAWVEGFAQEAGDAMSAGSIARLNVDDAAEAVEPELLDGWTAVMDPGSGKTYYENVGLGETTWDPPYAVQAEPELAP